MKANSSGPVIFGLLLLLFACIPAAVSAADPAIATLAEYFDLLGSGNIESAHYLWRDSSLQRAERFDIEYTDIPLKCDCVSPIVRDLDVMRFHLQRTAKSVEDMDDPNFKQLLYSELVDGKLVEYKYYMYFDGNYWWLCYPQDYYCREWPVQETKYFRIHVDSSAARHLNPVSLDAADKWVEQMARTLKLSDQQMKSLGQDKIEYYFCGNDSTVLKITGHLVKGVFDMASNDLITAFFPHYHELTHLLVNIKLHSLPLYTQPLLREGIAVYYGGRWGKSPSSLMGLGAFLYREKLVYFDSLLAMPLFNVHSGADIAYPVAGLFSSYLMDKLGRDGYFELYLALSGDFNALYAQTVEQVKQTMVEATESDDWENFMSGFDKYIDDMMKNKTVIKPGALTKGKELVEGEHYSVRSEKDWIGFEFSFGHNQPAAGNLLFGHDDRLVGIGSLLYDEQYGGGAALNGYRYGVRFDSNEVGLYDYGTSQLLAKYIWGISPSDDYFNADKNLITVMIRKDLLGDKWPSDGDVEFLNQ